MSGLRCILTLFLLVCSFPAVHAQEGLRAAARGNLQAVCEDPDGLRWAVTDAGEILHSADGSAWTVLDFNEAYAGYYPQMDFRAVAAGGGAVMVAGLDPDGHLAVYTSSRGTVWSARSLDYTEEGERRELDVTPCSLSYDPLRDSFFLCGTHGTLFEMPGCSHCNRLTRYPADTLYARIPEGFSALLLGSGGFKMIEKL
ncbi:MAG: hypothetical protein GXY24_06140 [Bacteroidales bacterium]|jgi:hypothetical protein|nr:hypothetical protein [Bacteroidales bacterium]